MERGGDCVFPDFQTRLARIREFMNARKKLLDEFGTTDAIPDQHRDALADAFSDISKDSPTLFKKLNEYPEKHKEDIDGMLSHFEQVTHGNQTQETASEMVGQMIFDAARRRSTSTPHTS